MTAIFERLKWFGPLTSSANILRQKPGWKMSLNPSKRGSGGNNCVSGLRFTIRVLVLETFTIEDAVIFETSFFVHKINITEYLHWSLSLAPSQTTFVRVISKEEKIPSFTRSSSYGLNVWSMNHFAENLRSTNDEGHS